MPNLFVEHFQGDSVDANELSRLSEGWASRTNDNASPPSTVGGEFEHFRSCSLDTSNSGSDEDEPLFMVN